MSFFIRSNLAQLFLLTLLNFSINAQDTAKPDVTTGYSEALDFLFNLKSTGESAKINSEIMFQRDVGTFKLFEGEIFRYPEYKSNQYALLFIGKGEFSFTPPIAIERKQLYRFYEKENFEMEFKQLFLLFDDNTYDEITVELSFQETKTAPLEREIKEFITYFKEYDFDDSRQDFLRSMMMEGRNGFFYSQIQESKFDPVFFQIDPFEIEEVSFMKGARGGTKNYRELINLFPAKEETLKPFYSKKPNKYFLDLITYRIESTISNNLDFSSKCTIDFESKEKDQEWTMLYLYEELRVDSVKWEDGNRAKFLNPEESGEVWIKCKSDYLDGNQHILTIYYHGDLLEKNDLGWIELKSSIYWYPRFDNREKAAFGLIFNTPSKYDFISVGELINKVERDEIITSTYFSNTPSRNLSFNIGNFKNYEVKKENLPEVNVYISEFGHQLVRRNLIDQGILSISDASKYIAQDISNSIALFTELFGPLSTNSINATEIPYLHGEAFPGLLHLSWATVVQTNFEGEDEIFRAHEAAHQWWGIGVDIDTYHDQWLSEGLAQYSGLWYLQAAKNDNELFFDILNGWRDEILNVRNYIFGSGQEAGPIWLGYRTSSSQTWGDYDLIIYKKGAWIIHMLRAMLLDLNTMNEDRVKAMMKDYYQAFKDRSACTEDFKKIVDKHFGENMSWFFDQYVYGTDIPLYKVAYKTKKTNEDKTIITLRVRQEGVPENFKMYVPFKLVFKNDMIGRIRIEVKGKETIYSTPPIDGKLEELIFNDLESVLCEVEYEDWN